MSPGWRVALLLGLLVAGARVAAAEPLVYRGESTLWQDTLWSGEVLVDGILTVAPGVTLEIRPGTTVRFTPFDSNGDGIGEHELFIQGVLKAVGTAAQPIRFTSSAVRPTPGDWGAINILGSEEESRFEQCRVEYAYRGFHAHFSKALLIDDEFRYNVRGLQFQESQVELRRCRVVENLNGLQFRDSRVVISDCLVAENAWGLRCVYSQGSIVGSRFEGNRINGVNLRDSQFTVRDSFLVGNRRGLYLQRSTVAVSGNRIDDNSEHGILLEQSQAQVSDNRLSGNGRAGVKWVDSTGVFRANQLTESGEYALVNDGAQPVDARGNGWGTTDPLLIARLIRDGADRPGMGLVDAGDPLPVATPSTAVGGCDPSGPTTHKETR